MDSIDEARLMVESVELMAAEFDLDVHRELDLVECQDDWGSVIGDTYSVTGDFYLYPLTSEEEAPIGRLEEWFSDAGESVTRQSETVEYRTFVTTFGEYQDVHVRAEEDQGQWSYQRIYMSVATECFVDPDPVDPATLGLDGPSDPHRLAPPFGVTEVCQLSTDAERATLAERAMKDFGPLGQDISELMHHLAACVIEENHVAGFIDVLSELRTVDGQQDGSLLGILMEDYVRPEGLLALTWALHIDDSLSHMDSERLGQLGGILAEARLSPDFIDALVRLGETPVRVAPYDVVTELPAGDSDSHVAPGESPAFYGWSAIANFLPGVAYREQELLVRAAESVLRLDKAIDGRWVAAGMSLNSLADGETALDPVPAVLEALEANPTAAVLVAESTGDPRVEALL
ncbi:hypothetical protein [Stackebrandtia soli]|uniref:hypothetical protein n=1 Tax=Stackebrandtia soli TaxID=1892856 RepID=UPI0039E93949